MLVPRLPFRGKMQTCPKLNAESGGNRLNASQPVENRVVLTATTNSAEENDSQSGGYVSQLDLIREKMLESGLSEDVYAAARSNFEDLVHSQYDDRCYTKNWRQWRVESRIWDYYCEPFKYAHKIAVAHCLESHHNHFLGKNLILDLHPCRQLP